MFEVVESVLEEEGLTHPYLATLIYFQLFIVVEDSSPDGAEIDQLRKIMRAVSTLEAELHKAGGTKLDSFRSGRVDDVLGALDKLKVDIEQLYPSRAPNRPQTDIGRKSIELYSLLMDAGVQDAWRCSRIVARLLVSTGISDSPEAKLTKSVYDRFQRQLVR